MLKQGGKDGQQGKSRIIDDLSDTSWLLSVVGELTKPQVVLCLLQILCSTFEVRPQCCLHWFQTSLHHCPDMWGEFGLTLLTYSKPNPRNTFYNNSKQSTQIKYSWTRMEHNTRTNCIKAKRLPKSRNSSNNHLVVSCLVWKTSAVKTSDFFFSCSFKYYPCCKSKHAHTHTHCLFLTWHPGFVQVSADSWLWMWHCYLESTHDYVTENRKHCLVMFCFGSVMNQTLQHTKTCCGAVLL